MNVLLGRLQIYMPDILYKMMEVCVFPFFYIFLFGMMIYFFRDRFLPVFKKWKWAFIAAYVFWSSMPEQITGIFEGVRYNIVTTVLLMCAIFSVGYGFGKHRFKTDYSYAFYLWHMVVINFVRHHFVNHLRIDHTMFGWMALIIAAISTLAWLSVQLIDKRLCYKLQNKVFRIMGIS